MKDRGIFSLQLYFLRDRKFLFACCEIYVEIVRIDNLKILSRKTNLGIFFLWLNTRLKKNELVVLEMLFYVYFIVII